MATLDFNSLFGQDPRLLQQSMDLQMAKLSPEERLYMMGAQGGRAIGQGLGSLFGVDVEDPTIKKASALRALASEFDTNTPEGLAQFAQVASRIDPRAGALAAQQAQSMMRTQSEITAKQAEAAAKLSEKLTPEQRNAAALADTVASRGTEEWNKAYSEGLTRLTTKPEAQRKTSTVTAGGRKLLIDDLTGETIKDLGPAGKTLEESLGAGLGMIGRALAAGQKKEAEGTAEFAAKDFNTLGSSVAAGTASKRNVSVLENAMKNAFTGKFSDVKEGVVTGLEGLGIKVGEDLKQAASNTQLINAMGTRYVFPLVKNFPGSLAAKELDRLEKTAPNSLQQPETIQTLLNLLKQDLAENEYTYNKAKQYKEKNNGFVTGFNQADAKIEFQNKLTDLRNRVQAARRAGRMTAAERDQINALKKELGVE